MDGIIAGAPAAGARPDNLYCYGPVSGPVSEGLPYPTGRGADQERAAASSGSPRSSRTMVAALRPGPAETDPPGWVVEPVW